ncbi:MAG: transposase [Clostridiales bacterium]|nr:transposase [Clostridiales bacterium]
MEDKYIAIQYLNKVDQYSIKSLYCKLHISRSGYYKWLKQEPSERQKVNEQLVEWIKEYYEERDVILGYRQMTITINREKNVHYNKKQYYRLMYILDLKSVCRKSRYNYIKSTPEVTAENHTKSRFHGSCTEREMANGCNRSCVKKSTPAAQQEWIEAIMQSVLLLFRLST